MSLWSNLYVGTSGLQTSQNALNTVSHNIVNADTTGYTRQQVQQSDKNYITISRSLSGVSSPQYGLGVSYSKVKHIRDYFLDKTYRRESGRENFYQVSSETLSEVEDLLGEMDGEAFQETLTDLWSAVQELSKDPCSSVTQGTLVQQAAKFLSRGQAVYDGLINYQNNLNNQIKQKVDRINELGNNLKALNDQIRTIEAGKIENANDLRDTRDLVLDELAELCSISYDEDSFGNVFVQIEGVDFVKGSTVYEIGLDADQTTGFYTPYWPQNAEYIIDASGEKIYDTSNAHVYNLNTEISSALNTDIGGLKAMLLARGDRWANYSDIETDYDSISQSVLMNVEAEFDQLIHNVMTAVNDVLADAAGVKELTSIDADGKEVSVRAVKVSEAGYMTDTDGSPLQMYMLNSGEGYKKQTLTVRDENGVDTTDEYWVYQEENSDIPTSLYTLQNTQINQRLMQTPTLLGFRLPDGSEDIATMEALKAAFTTEDYTLNPKVLKKVDLIGYYDDLVSQVANSAYVFGTIAKSQETTVEATKSARDQVHAVSTDEELSNMIKFQNAYNASSRFINVVDEMIEHILTSLG